MHSLCLGRTGGVSDHEVRRGLGADTGHPEPPAAPAAVRDARREEPGARVGMSRAGFGPGVGGSGVCCFHQDGC